MQHSTWTTQPPVMPNHIHQQQQQQRFNNGYFAGKSAAQVPAVPLQLRPAVYGKVPAQWGPVQKYQQMQGQGAMSLGGGVAVLQGPQGVSLRGADGTTVTVPPQIRVKDPAVRGNVLYDIATSNMEPTVGMWEYLEGQERGGTHRVQCHRATLCKLFLEDRCGQGPKCKSFHIDKQVVASLRAEHNVEFDQSFLTEVAVVTADGCVSAVRYKNIGRTRGLDAYKAALPGLNPVPPAKVCSQYAATMLCPDERSCEFIHIKPADLREAVRRTPCCFTHGDASTETALRVGDTVELKGRAGGTGGVSPSASASAPVSWSLPISRVALTNGGAKRLAGGVLSMHDVCVMHVKSRCKFGRGCDRVHVCRVWAGDVGLAGLLSTRPRAAGGSALSPSTSCGTARSHPPSPSGFSLYSLSSVSDTDTSVHTPLHRAMPGYAPVLTHTPSANSICVSNSSIGPLSLHTQGSFASSCTMSPNSQRVGLSSLVSMTETDDEETPPTATNSVASSRRLTAFPAFNLQTSEHTESDGVNTDTDNDNERDVHTPVLDHLDDLSESILNLIES